MIYLDNAATTHMLPCVQEAVHPWLSGVKFGNASTLHSVGREARAAVEQARCNVANLVNAEPNEIIFTSGGTESDNTAILGIVPYLKALGKRKIIVSAIEHHAILKLQSYLKLLDIEMEIAPVKRSGEIDYDWLFSKVVNDDIGLVSIMLANNEIGVVQELALISEFCHNHECLVHTDAVQAEALLQLMNADGVCISAASACFAGSLEPSHVLKAIGMSDDEARATIRISLGVNNTNVEMEQAAQLLSKNVSRIKRMYQ